MAKLALQIVHVQSDAASRFELSRAANIKPRFVQPALRKVARPHQELVEAPSCNVKGAHTKTPGVAQHAVCGVCGRRDSPCCERRSTRPPPLSTTGAVGARKWQRELRRWLAARLPCSTLLEAAAGWRGPALQIVHVQSDAARGDWNFLSCRGPRTSSRGPCSPHSGRSHDHIKSWWTHLPAMSKEHTRGRRW